MDANNRIPWDPASSIPSLVGSLLSTLASLLVIVLWLVTNKSKRRNRRDFRYVLILNLTTAEFFNSLNNTISGFAVAAAHEALPAGAACNFNGWIGQLSVQAVDFSILAISIITLLIIQLRSFILYASVTVKVLICVSVWIVPICTSTIAYAKSYYGPVSGNWCWIKPQYKQERYIFTHGWRFAILFITLCTYLFVFIYMSQRVRPDNLSNGSIDSQKMGPIRRHSIDTFSPLPTPKGVPQFQSNLSPPELKLETHGLDLSLPPTGAPVQPSSLLSPHRFDSKPMSFPFPEEPLHSPASRTSHQNLALNAEAPWGSNITLAPVTHKSKVDKEIWKIMILNMYPVIYLVLWIPGIANRVAEATGHPSRVLVILQSSTQFIGLANAMLYLYKEHGRDVREWWASLPWKKRSVPANKRESSDV